MSLLPSPESRQSQLDEAVLSLSSISSELLSSYSTLREKADRVENELQRRLGELEAMLDALPTGVLVRDLEGHVARAGGAALEILGRTQEELQSLDLDELFEQAPRQGEALRLQKPDGKEVLVQRRTAAVHTAAGEHIGVVEILDDQTERLGLAAQIHRMDKMAALGTMAAGIAHEIRNPMNAIRGFAELLLRAQKAGTSDPERTERWALNVARGASEIESIVASMLTFADPRPLQLETVPVRELCDAAVERAAEHRDESTPWKISIHGEARNLVCDRIKLRQALRNLVANAIDIQPDGGTVELRVQEQQQDVLFTVADSGPGLTADVRDRMCDPFFTTRAEGTGLGLTLVSTIAELHGGRLEISDQPDPELGGAAFTLRLPLESTACRRASALDMQASPVSLPRASSRTDSQNVNPL